MIALLYLMSILVYLQSYGTISTMLCIFENTKSWILYEQNYFRGAGLLLYFVKLLTLENSPEL